MIIDCAHLHLSIDNVIEIPICAQPQLCFSLEVVLSLHRYSLEGHNFWIYWKTRWYAHHHHHHHHLSLCIGTTTTTANLFDYDLEFDRAIMEISHYNWSSDISFFREKSEKLGWRTCASNRMNSLTQGALNYTRITLKQIRYLSIIPLFLFACLFNAICKENIAIASLQPWDYLHF